jgi:hypothetical protein
VELGLARQVIIELQVVAAGPEQMEATLRLKKEEMAAQVLQAQ